MNSVLAFAYPEDEQFFHDLLCGSGEPLTDYAHFFDFRSPAIKRREFNARRNKLLAELKQKYGSACQLRFAHCCQPDGQIVVDHLIPLSSNVLNKKLRQVSPEPKRKVITQSFGSNHIDNLVVACSACNSYKKHNFLRSEHLQHILKQRRERHLGNVEARE